MDTIRNYIESVFANLPRSRDMLRLKEEMTLNMEEKYHQLKQEGKSENEAIGTVLAEFGNIEEIMEAYQLEKEADNAESEDTVYFSTEEVDAYYEHRQQFSFAIASGVFLCILAPAALLGVLFFTGESDQGIALGLVPFFVLVAAALVLFIKFGMQESSFNFEFQLIEIEPALYKHLNNEYKAFQKRLGSAIALGVVLCLLGVLTLLLSQALFPSTDLLGVSALLGCIAAGVFIFVLYGIQNDTYQKLLSVGDHTPEKVRAKRDSEAVANIVFPIAGVVYLMAGLFFNAWGVAWIIFPVLGVLFGIYTAITEGSQSSRRK